MLWRVGRTRYRSEDEVYKLAYATTWAKWFSPEHTIRVYVTAIKSPLKSLNFTTLKVKDGLCDHFRTVAGKRPSVDTEAPDVRIHAFLTKGHFLCMDSTTNIWQLVNRSSAVKENLAAGILRLSGWQPGQSLLDPMCGSGTFLVEAAQMTLNIANWAVPSPTRNFDTAEYGRCCLKINVCRCVRCRCSAPISIRTRSPRRRKISPRPVLPNRSNSSSTAMLDLNRRPPKAYGSTIRLMVFAYAVAGTGRSGDQSFVWQRFAGWNCYFLSADTQLAKLIGLRASHRA